MILRRVGITAEWTSPWGQVFVDLFFTQRKDGRRELPLADSTLHIFTQRTNGKQRDEVQGKITYYLQKPVVGLLVALRAIELPFPDFLFPRLCPHYDEHHSLLEMNPLVRYFAILI